MAKASVLLQYLQQIEVASPAAMEAFIEAAGGGTGQHAVSVLQSVLGGRTQFEPSDLAALHTAFQTHPEDVLGYVIEEVSSSGTQKGRAAAAHNVQSAGAPSAENDYGWVQGGQTLDFEALDSGYSFQTPGGVPSWQELGATDAEGRITRDVVRDWRQPNPQYETYGPHQTDPQSLRAYGKQRWSDINASIAGARPDYQTGTTIGDEVRTNVLSSFSRTYSGGTVSSQSRGRDPQTGRFVKMQDYLPTEGEQKEILQDLATFVQEMLVQKYARLPIERMGMHADGSNTGTLRKAVSNLTVHVERSRGENFSVRLELPDMVRPSRHSGDEPVSVRYYGPRVFQGRRGLMRRRTGQSAGFRFQIRGEWIATRSVRPSRKDLNLFDLTSGERQQIVLEYTKLLMAKVKARKAGNAAQPRTK